MSTGSILSILAYSQYGYHLVCHTGLSLVHCSYLSVGSLHILPLQDLDISTIGRRGCRETEVVHVGESEAHRDHGMQAGDLDNE